MAQVVRPPPAGTKENADVVSVKVSSMKSMFEKPKKTDQDAAAPPPRRRQLRGNDWANGNGVVAGARFIFVLFVFLLSRNIFAGMLHYFRRIMFNWHLCLL